MPPSSPRVQRQGPLQSKKGLAVIIALIILSIGAVGVVFVLPRVVSTSSNDTLNRPFQDVGVPPRVPALDQTRSPSQPKPSADTTTKQKAIPQTEPNQKIAEGLLSEALRKLARLENEGAKIWGKDIAENQLPQGAGNFGKSKPRIR